MVFPRSSLCAWAQVEVFTHVAEDSSSYFLVQIHQAFPPESQVLMVGFRFDCYFMVVLVQIHRLIISELLLKVGL